MPSSAQTKVSGPKKENKHSVAKNATQSVPIRDASSKSTKGDSAKAYENTPAPPLTSKAVQGKTPSDPAQPLVKSVQDTTEEGSSGVGVNKKKQKRRQKEAARKAAEQASLNGPPLDPELVGVPNAEYQDLVKEMEEAHARGQTNGYSYGGSEYDDNQEYEPDEEALYYAEGSSQAYRDAYAPHTNGHTVHDYIPQDALAGKSKKKKKAKANSFSQDAYSRENPSLAVQRSYQTPPPPPPPPLSQNGLPNTHRSTHNDSKDRIWNTSTAEERERIKEFWLSLGEEDRRSLVKVEKEAVLKKMKEQQKHSCSCTVCGRKRTAIEEELEVLYDAYYEELEVYANPDQPSPNHGVPPRNYAHPVARMPPNRPSHVQRPHASRGRIQELRDDEELDEEDYDEDEDDEGFSDDEQTMRPPADRTAEFLNFGKNLTVQGGILTVADDLLKNDGKKFIEMMEQLAERRMQREEDQYARNGGTHQAIPNHNHGPSAEDDGYDDEEEDEEYDEDDEDFDEEDEMESMTEHERMEEGRRMFQIFAARMFEQRVLTAYREKVALERQQKLLEELDDESQVNAQRQAKKEKEAQKKKEKKRQQKEAKDAEKVKREEEKAREEAEAKAFEEKKAEEIRQRKEEQRKKREAEKKSQEEEKHRKEADKQRRIQEAKEQQAEAERKQREQKDREKKKREEAKKKEREDREAREREAKEKKEREAVDRREYDLKLKADNEAKERVKKEAQAASKKQSPANGPTSSTSGLHPPSTTSSHTSPRLQIATPVVPKAPTPVRLRQASVQETRSNSPKPSQLASSSTTTSPGVSSGMQNGQGPVSVKPATQGTPTQSTQLPSQISPGLSPGQSVHPPGFPSVPPVSGNTYPPGFGPPISPTSAQFAHSHLNQPQIGNGSSGNFMAPNGVSYPPGFGGPGHMPVGRGTMMAPSLPHISTGGLPGANINDVARYGMSRDNIPSQTHSRNTSASFDRSALETPSISAQTQPIARPAPIKRPSSVTPHQQTEDSRPRNTDVDDLSSHLGSSALIDDTDDFGPQEDESRHLNMPPGLSRNAGPGFGVSPGFPNPIGLPAHHTFPRNMQAMNGNHWASQQSPFGASPMSGPPSWSNPPGFGRANNGTGFGSIGGSARPSGSRAVTIRLLLRTACEKLRARSPINQAYGWHHADELLHEIQTMRPGHEAPIQMLEMLDICDTEGNSQNGGGSFSKVQDDPMGPLIKFDPGRNMSMSGRGPGDIGSPIVGGGGMIGQRPFQQPGGF